MNPKLTPPVVPNHRMLRRIGHGSYGDVWLALDAMQKWTAVKVVFRRPDDAGRSYEQEFRGLVRYEDLSGKHPGLMPVRSVGRDDSAGFFYYAMELADDFRTRAPLPRVAACDLSNAEPLAENYEPWTLGMQLASGGRLPPPECVSHGLALAEAMECLHQADLLHRDVKPSNIIFVNGRPKLADVGLVTAVDATVMSFVGTHGFVPEHGAGTPSGDLFALGKVIFMMFSGRKVEEFPNMPGDFATMTPAERGQVSELCAITDRACAAATKERYDSAAALRGDLELLRNKESVLGVRRIEARLRQAKIALSALVPLSLVLLLGALAWNWRLGWQRQKETAELGVRQVSRIVLRREGWAERDWKAVKSANPRAQDTELLRQGVATLSGLDSHAIGVWKGIDGTSAAFSPNGQVLVTGFRGGRASLVVDMTNRTELPVAGEGVAGWSTESEPLILQVEPTGCALREARTGRTRRVFPFAKGEHQVEQSSPVLALSADCRLLAAQLTSGRTNWVIVWDSETGAVVGECQEKASVLRFAPDGSLLAIGHDNGHISVYRLRPFRIEVSLPAALGPAPIQALDFVEDRKVSPEQTGSGGRWLLASGDRGALIVVWDLSKSIPRAFCRGSTWEVGSVAFSPDGMTLASAGRNGVMMWDTATGREILRADQHNGSNTRALAFDRVGKMLFAASTSESGPSDLCLMQLEPHRGISTLRGLALPVRHVGFSLDSRLIGAISDEWLLGVWEVGSARLLRVFELSPGDYADNCGQTFDKDGRVVVVATRTEARKFDIETGSKLSAWSLPPGFGNKLSFTPEGELRIARIESTFSVERYRRWRIYRLTDGIRPAMVQEQTDSRYETVNLAFSADSRTLMAFVENRVSKLKSCIALDGWSGNEIWRRDTPERKNWPTVRLDPTGAWCLYSIRDDDLYSIVAVADGHPVVSAFRCWAVSPSAQDYLVQGFGFDPGMNYGLLRTRDGRLPATPFSMDGGHSVDTDTFSPDGKLLAWGNMDGSICVANVAEVRSRVDELVGRRPRFPSAK